MAKDFSDVDYQEAWLIADGYGSVTEQVGTEQSWDWSHIRDSKEETLERIYHHLRDKHNARVRQND
jgi:hypothetical protein